MHHARLRLARQPAQLSHRRAIHRERRLRLRLGAVHQGVRGGVDHHVGPQLGERRGHGGVARDVELRPRQRDQRHLGRRAGREVVPQHPARAQQQHAHQSCFRYSAFDAR